LIGHTVLPSSIGWVGSVAGSLFGLIVMMPLFARGGLGAGDVKLLGGIGACIGLHDAVAVFMMFGLLAGGLATALLLAQGRRPSMAAYGERIEDAVRLADPVRRKRVLPLAPWMATAMLVLAAGSLWRW
jgi:Flp pilus assembly protein protease CpaA